MLGPGEFFEGLALGGREFFSGTLGNLLVQHSCRQAKNTCTHACMVE